MTNTFTPFVNILSVAILLAITIWVYRDAKAIGDDRGRSPGLVNTKPASWAMGVFLLLILFLPVYLVVRVRYKHLLSVRRALIATDPDSDLTDTEGVWPPPPRRPAA